MDIRFALKVWTTSDTKHQDFFQQFLSAHLYTKYKKQIAQSTTAGNKCTRARTTNTGKHTEQSLRASGWDQPFVLTHGEKCCILRLLAKKIQERAERTGEDQTSSGTFL